MFLSVSAGPLGPAPGAGQKKRAPWDLKGQVNDLRAQAGTFKETIQGLDSENRALKQQVARLEQELHQAVAQNRELGSRAR